MALPKISEKRITVGKLYFHKKMGMVQRIRITNKQFWELRKEYDIVSGCQKARLWMLWFQMMYKSIIPNGHKYLINFSK